MPATWSLLRARSHSNLRQYEREPSVSRKNTKTVRLNSKTSLKMKPPQLTKSTCLHDTRDAVGFYKNWKKKVRLIINNEYKVLILGWVGIKELKVLGVT